MKRVITGSRSKTLASESRCHNAKDKLRQGHLSGLLRPALCDGASPSKKQTWNCEQSSLDLHYCQKAVTAGGSAAAGREGSLCESPPAPELDSQPETLRPGKTHGGSTPSSAPHPSPRAAKGHLGTW